MDTTPREGNGDRERGRSHVIALNVPASLAPLLLDGIARIPESTISPEERRLLTATVTTPLQQVTNMRGAGATGGQTMRDPGSRSPSDRDDS